MFLLEITEKEGYRFLLVRQTRYFEKLFRCKTPKCWIDFFFLIFKCSKCTKIKGNPKGRKQTKTPGN